MIRIALLLVIAGSAARAQAPVTPPADTLPRTALVVSGGVSLGSYQAGATWAFIYALKHRDELARARQAYPPLARFRTPPGHTLDVLAGASAGNINAVLAAVEYCAQDMSHDPETSLLWKFWLAIGWSGLVKDQVKEPEIAPFSRSVAAPIWSSLDSAMKGGARRPDCDLLLGITTTKLTPHLVHVGPAIDVPIQRFAGVFRLVADSVTGGLAFAEPRASDVSAQDLSDILILDPSKDADGVPRRLGNRARDYALSVGTVRQLVEASGSFPLAFAPRTVAYRALDTLKWSAERQAVPCLTTGVASPRCTPPDTALFVDGGLFDNRPLGLALALSHGVERGDGRPPASRLLYFVDDDARRLDSSATGAASSAAQTRPEPRAGLSAAIRVFSQAVNTGYNTELREFVRLIAREPGGRVSLGVTTRYPRLMAEHLGHFGAFAARSFREHDFYAGVYDGLRSAFRYLYCGNDVGAGVALAGASAEGMPCEEAWLRLVLTRDLVSLQPAGRAVVDRLLSLETKAPKPALPNGAGFRGAKLVALVDANVDARKPGTRCRARGSVIEAPLCTEQLLSVLSAWRDSLERQGEWKRELCGASRFSLAPHSKSGTSLLPGLPGRVSLARYADDCGILRDPQAVYHGMVMTALARMRTVEIEVDRIDGRGWPRAIGVPLFYERAYNESFRSCFQVHSLPCADANPTTSDVMGGWWYDGASRLIPITAAVRRDGSAHWLEWRPTAYLFRASGTSVALVAPFDLMRAKESTFGAAGAGVTVIPPTSLLTSVSVSEIWVRGRPNTDLTLALVSGVVRVGLRAPNTSVGEFASLGNLTIGVGDANGLGARFVGWLASLVF